MAITTLDGVIAGLVPPANMAKNYNGAIASGAQWASMWYAPGIPSAATANAAGVSGAALTGPLTGAIPYNNPVAGNSYLAQWSFMRGKNPNAGLALVALVDRLWHNSGLDRTLTTAQTVNSVAWPARDANGSTNGEGVYIGIEISTTMGTGVPTVTMTYTNSAGTAGKTASPVGAIVASSPVSTFIPLALAAGDTGVRSIQSIQFSASWGTAGVLHLVAYRVIAMLPMDQVGYTDKSMYGDAVSLGMPIIFDSSVLQILGVGTSNNSFVGPASVIGLTQG